MDGGKHQNAAWLSLEGELGRLWEQGEETASEGQRAIHGWDFLLQGER